MRDTLHIRSIMRSHNVPSSFIWTNKYKNKRTVKCWVGFSTNVNDLISDLTNNGYTVRYNKATIDYFTRRCSSVIVDAKL